MVFLRRPLLLQLSSSQIVSFLPCVQSSCIRLRGARKQPRHGLEQWFHYNNGVDDIASDDEVESDAAVNTNLTTTGVITNTAYARASSLRTGSEVDAGKPVDQRGLFRRA